MKYRNMTASGWAKTKKQKTNPTGGEGSVQNPNKGSSIIGKKTLEGLKGIFY